MSDDTENIRIEYQPTLDPQVCKFIVDRPMFTDGTFNCRDKKAAQGSPLMEALFEIDGIREISVSGNTLSITKSTPEPWVDLRDRISTVFREQIDSGKQLISADVTKKEASEEHIRQKVEHLFETEINPSLAMHGGRVELADVVGTSVHVRLAGGCQGCAGARMTLHNGIENVIRRILPDVTEVVDVTDHTGGETPYY